MVRGGMMLPRAPPAPRSGMKFAEDSLHGYPSPCLFIPRLSEFIGTLPAAVRHLALALYG